MNQFNYARLYRISDTCLYLEAQKFLKEVDPPDRSQLTGLLTYSRTWSELKWFVKHQAERDFGTKQKHYGTFYKCLKQYLEQKLRSYIQEEFAAHQSGMTKKEKKDFTDTWSERLAQEFIQHLTVHAQYLLKNRAGA